jgi:cell division protein FtsI/penicillin-binding protein 2
MKSNGYEFEADKFIASFAGFFPADNPKYVLVVCYETGRVEGVPYIHQGGGRPAMAFAEVVKRMGCGVKKQ